MDNLGDWIYIVFLIVAAVSGLFSSKNKKKHPTQVLGQPEYEPAKEEHAPLAKAFGKYWKRLPLLLKRKKKRKRKKRYGNRILSWLPNRKSTNPKSVHPRSRIFRPKRNMPF